MMSRTEAILAEIAKPEATRDSIAAVYQMGIIEMNMHVDTVDWRRVNEAILQRYKASGLIYIKRLAWNTL
jgi:hypothetical protein